MTKLLIGMVIVTYFARFNKSGKTTLFPHSLLSAIPSKTAMPRSHCRDMKKLFPDPMEKCISGKVSNGSVSIDQAGV